MLNTTVQENICFQPLARVVKLAAGIELISSRLGDYILRLRCFLLPARGEVLPLYTLISL